MSRHLRRIIIIGMGFVIAGTVGFIGAKYVKTKVENTANPSIQAEQTKVAKAKAEPLKSEQTKNIYQTLMNTTQPVYDMFSASIEKSVEFCASKEKFITDIKNALGKIENKDFPKDLQSTIDDFKDGLNGYLDYCKANKDGRNTRFEHEINILLDKGSIIMAVCEKNGAKEKVKTGETSGQLKGEVKLSKGEYTKSNKLFATKFVNYVYGAEGDFLYLVKDTFNKDPNSNDFESSWQELIRCLPRTMQYLESMDIGNVPDDLKKYYDKYLKNLKFINANTGFVLDRDRHGHRFLNKSLDNKILDTVIYLEDMNTPVIDICKKHGVKVYDDYKQYE